MSKELVLFALHVLSGTPAHPENDAASSATTAAPLVPEVREEELLLFALILDGATLTESLTAYGQPEDPLLPVGELARLLDLNVDVSPSQGIVTGTLGESQRSLTVDLRQGLARSGGKSFRLEEAQVATSSGDIFVAASVLQQMLPIEVESDPGRLELKLKATEKLPIQARLERQQRMTGVNSETGTSDPVFQVATPYEMLTAPAFDVALEAGRDTRGTRFPRRYDVRFAGDLLYMGYQGFIGSDERGKANSARLLFERRSSAGRLLGPIGATYVGAGDVFTPALAMGPRSVSGRGFSFSTANPGEASVFQRITLRGELPIGYDVELYINDILRSGQRSPVEGRYEFLDVPLVRGLNVLRVVTYGPRGERSEQTRVINVGGGQLAKGKLTADFGLVQQDEPLLRVRSDDEIGTRPDSGAVRAVASLAYGLAPEATLIAGAAIYPDAAGRSRKLFTAGARASVLGFAVQADGARDQSGNAMSLGVAGRKLGVSTIARHVEYSGNFVDETLSVYSFSRPLARHTDLSADFLLPFSASKPIPVSLSAERNGYADGGVTWLGLTRASTNVSTVQLSAGLDYLHESLPGGASTQRLGGNLSASTFVDFKWQLRGVIDYEVVPKRELRAASATANRQISEVVGVQFGIGRTFGADKDLAVQSGVFFRLPFADLAVSGDYATAKNDWRLGLRLAFGLGFDPLASRYRMLRPGAAAGASAAFHAFLDNNGNGLFEKGEEPVRGLGIEGGERKIVTDANGMAFASGLGSGISRRLRTNMDGVDSFYVKAPPSNVEFSARPGHVVKIAYPLVPVSEVVAHVKLRQDDELVGLSALRVRLVQEGSEPIEATTEYDGSVIFDKIRPGSYRFELDPEQAANLKMSLKELIVVEVTADGAAEIEAEVVLEGKR